VNIVSFEYLLFLIVVFIVYYLMGNNWKRYLLCVASIAFYAQGQTSYVIIMLISVLVNYTAGLSYASTKAPKRLIFYLSIIFNVGLLVYFKYLGYWLSQINPYLHIMPDQNVLHLSNLILPIGISFYTFNAIGYTVDTYLQVIKPERNIVNYLIYQAFFPHVLSGPVARTRLLLPQIRKPHKLEYDIVVSGLRLILLGFFKKLVIANNLRPLVAASFNNYQFQSGTSLLFASFLYYGEIYADFSGYTDIALGTAKLFGFDLIPNFNKPFLSTSVTDFWRRWHISLSSWVRDYLYYPILYKFRNYKELSVLIATLVTFFVIGMWHGPKSNFAIFGLLQFIFISTEMYITRYIKARDWKFPKIIQLFQMIATFIVMSLFFVFLKANTLNQATVTLERIFTVPGKLAIFDKTYLICGGLGIILLFLGEVISRQQDLTDYISGKKKIIRWAVYLVLVTLILVLGNFNNSSFIYYQF